MIDTAAHRERMREQAPLVHNITNVVVTNFTANGLYAAGAKPVMAYAEEEAADMAAAADALVLNIGTLTRQTNDAMMIAGRSAAAAGTPIILDPVGAGATSFRTETARKLLQELPIACLRGNAGEIASLVDEEVEVHGVDSGTISDAAATAVRAAEQFETVTVLTGETDYITDGSTLYACTGGSVMQTKITGAGCLLTSLIGAFTASGEDTLSSAAAACSFYAAAAEAAEERASFAGPGHFQVHLLDMLDLLAADELTQKEKLKEVTTS
ncbi:hydroxyethylthiazole kinase [Alkalicoccus chagannorensis]|uniref:hydroxyethylthiazole kinase n=1 Tax=Alkalicoccus chagannorensis TaxID=427072 RepID=UPI0003F9B4B0|nr:hydroxyethylthiazole kinase [Alkalicoccus chagannorensis]